MIKACVSANNEKLLKKETNPYQNTVHPVLCGEHILTATGAVPFLMSCNSIHCQPKPDFAKTMQRNSSSSQITELNEGRLFCWSNCFGMSWCSSTLCHLPGAILSGFGTVVVFDVLDGTCDWSTSNLFSPLSLVCWLPVAFPFSVWETTVF